MRIRIVGVVLVACVLATPRWVGAQDAQLRVFAESLIAQLKTRGKSPAAVTAFSNADYGPAFSNFIVDRLSVLLARGSADLELVARDRIEEATKELNLQLTV